MPKAPPDHSHADYKAQKYFVFDDRLQIHEEHKSMLEGHFFLNEYGVDIVGTSAYAGRGELAAVHKVASNGRNYVLVRKAIRADRDQQRGIFPAKASKAQLWPERSSDEIKEILFRLDEVQNALKALMQAKPEHLGMGHNWRETMAFTPEI